MASLRKSERLISSRGHGCFTINPSQPMAAATRFPSHGSGRPGLELRTATKLSSVGFEPRPFRPLVYESVALTTRPHAHPYAHPCHVCSHSLLQWTELALNLNNYSRSKLIGIEHLETLPLCRGDDPTMLRVPSKLST